MHGFNAREELWPREEMIWRREARQDRSCGIPVGVIARHWGGFSIMAAVHDSLIVGSAMVLGLVYPIDARGFAPCAPFAEGAVPEEAAHPASRGEIQGGHVQGS